MPSPFLGMDPCIEALGRWAGFHFDFIVRCMDQLNERLPRNYVATLGERIELIDEQESRLSTRVVGPDVTVVQDPSRPAQANATLNSSLATLECHTLPNDIETLDLPRQLYVEITHLPDENIVTDIEVLSPSNKRAGSEDRLAYLAKRKNLKVHRVNLVELDLLIGGQRLPLRAELPAGDYFGFVTHGPNWHKTDVYGWSLRKPLPTLPIPLRREDGEVPLDLAAAFIQTYEHGRYDRLLRYNQASLSFLSDADRAWAGELIERSVK